jgi:hypothetical protein
MALTVHPNSLANLRPWPKGISGNAKGRTKGSRNRRSLRAEKIGKRLLQYFPWLRHKMETWSDVEDYKTFYRRRVRALEKDPKLAADASRIAALDVEGHVATWQVPQRLSGWVCSRCGIRFLDNQEANILPLFDGTTEPVWFHANCVLPELYERKARAQSLLSRVL